MGDTHSKCRATSIEVKFTGRKIWGRWVEDPHGPWTFPVGDKYWQWCREEGPAEAYWRRGFGVVITKWNKAGPHNIAEAKKMLAMEFKKIVLV